jgi:hypothetical protein
MGRLTETARWKRCVPRARLPTYAQASTNWEGRDRTYNLRFQGPPRFQLRHSPTDQGEWPDSNRRLSDSQSDALPPELHPPQSHCSRRDSNSDHALIRRLQVISLRLFQLSYGSESAPRVTARDIEKLTRAESVPRAVASVAPDVGYWRDQRSLPLAVLIRRPNAHLTYQCREQ